MNISVARPAYASAMLLAAVAFTACSTLTDPAASDVSPGSATFAKPGSETTPIVSSTSPSYGEQGETNKPVVISGSGFAQGAIVAWERNGVVDPRITVHSATVKSSSRIDAIISIAPDADASLYDVSVTNVYANSRKKGIGTELFEVKVTGGPKFVGSTFYILQDNTLGMTGDGKFLEPAGSAYAGHSRYKDAECGTLSQIKIGVGETGDALMSSYYTSGRGCKDAPRKVRIAYNRIDVASGNTTSEGVITTVTFMNVRKLQKAATSSEPGTAIPIGAFELRSMAFSDESYKCGAAGTGAILFSPVTSDGFETGANNVKVTRLSADQWLVETLPDEVVDGTVIHNDAAWCRGNGNLYHMPLRLIIRSSVGLP